MKMEIIGPLILSLLAGLSTLIGSIFIFIKVKKVGEYIVLSLSLSMGIMILLSVFDLIPSSIPIILNRYKYSYGILISILTFLLGYFTIDLINKKISNKNKNSLYNVGILSLISLILHNFPEGIAVFMSAYTNIKYGYKMFIAIMLHNIPEGISIAIPLNYSGESRGVVLFYTFLSAISEPLGALLSYIFLKDIINEIVLSLILLFVSGLMISLSIKNIYIEIKKYNKTKYMILGLILSVILFIIVIFI